METWAHGQDIADTLGLRREPTGRLRHIADLGVRTQAFSFRLRGLPVPTEPIRVELAGPAEPGKPREPRGPREPGGPSELAETAEPGGPARPGSTGQPGWTGEQAWTWGPDSAADRVTGDAEEFCLVVTHRRNVADTGLTVDGPVATQWIAIAQAFAGRASDPRPSGLDPRPRGGRS
jgi:uncharacterized protein (TIGR03083 family)